MSAREHYHNRTTACIVLPDLPPEIWLSIFRFATWSSNTFNPQLMVSTDTSYREQFREFKRSLVSFSFFSFLVGTTFLPEFLFRLRRDILFSSVKHGIPSHLRFCSN